MISVTNSLVMNKLFVYITGSIFNYGLSWETACLTMFDVPDLKKYHSLTGCFASVASSLLSIINDLSWIIKMDGVFRPLSQSHVRSLKLKNML